MAASAISNVFRPSSDGITRTLALVAKGTASEVRQYLALARALQALGGFRVRFVSHGVHAAAAAAAGLAFAPLKGDATAVLRTSAFRDAVATGNMLSVAKLLKADSDAHLEPNMPLILAACRDLDGLLCSIGALTECLAVGQKFQRPVILLPLLPYSPSGELPLAHVFSQPAKYAFLNKFSYELSGTLLWAVMGATYNKFRTQTLAIGPQGGYELAGVPQVCGFSHLVVPRPSDWSANIRTTGHWAEEHAGDAGDPAVAAALRTPTLASLVKKAASWEQARRPILVALEATPSPDPAALILALHNAAVRVGVSAVLLSGEADVAAARDSVRLSGLDVLWELPGQPAKRGAGGGGSGGKPGGGGGAPAPDGFPRVVVAASEAPLAWLFSAASVVVHSGGGGVTQAALAAGVPSAAFPAVGADHFWAARVGALGVGPLVAYEIREIAERLEEVVTVARSAPIVAAAGALARALAGAGAGVALAVAAIREVLSRPQHRHCGVTCTWAPDDSSASCTVCAAPFTLFNRRRHCRSCGRLACGACFPHRCHLPGFPEDAPQITCERCLDHRRAYFATHVHETPLPELPPGVVLPAPGYGPTAAAAPGGGSGGGGGSGSSSAAASRPGGAAVAPASGGGARGATATVSPAMHHMVRATGSGAGAGAAVVSPGFDAVNLFGDGGGLGLASPFDAPPVTSPAGRLGQGLAALGLGGVASPASASRTPAPPPAEDVEVPI
jgi:sterol 3beta-glucosyltransferase